MKLDPDRLKPTRNRLRRAQGQLAGVVRMLESGRDCDDVVTQLAAVSKAVDRAGVALVAIGLEQRLTGGDAVDSAGVEQLERVFLRLE
jgi:DNA-binding FrmR family transcriptional regulator